MCSVTYTLLTLDYKWYNIRHLSPTKATLRLFKDHTSFAGRLELHRRTRHFSHLLLIAFHVNRVLKYQRSRSLPVSGCRKYSLFIMSRVKIIFVSPVYSHLRRNCPNPELFAKRSLWLTFLCGDGQGFRLTTTARARHQDRALWQSGPMKDSPQCKTQKGRIDTQTGSPSCVFLKTVSCCSCVFLSQESSTGPLCHRARF